MSGLEASTTEELLDVIEVLGITADRGVTVESVAELVDAVTELRRRLAPAAFWPQGTFEEAQAIFGSVVFNTGSRTYQALDRRIKHALRVWDEKYGPLNPAQAEYADAVLASCLRRASVAAGSDRQKKWPFTQAEIGRTINHDRVHEGFKSRATEGEDGVAILKELLAS